MKRQRKRMDINRIMGFILSIAMLAGFCPQGVSFADIPIILPKVQAADNISNPRIVKDTSMEAGQKVTWDCVWFGSYPQSEVVEAGSEEETALKGMNTYYETKYESVNSSEFQAIASASYNENGDATVNGVKYRRLKGEDVTYTSVSQDGTTVYNWNHSYVNWHYFKYEPIKWYVLNKNENEALILSARALDDQRYNINYTSVTWENSSMRSWLNGYKQSVNQPQIDYSKENFICTAFSTVEKNAINITNVVNDNNINYKTDGGNNTWDRIFLLSESEVYNTEIAMKYGFVKDYNIHDEARKSYCSTYAFAMGTWRNTKGIGWWLRSPGGKSNSAAIVQADGWIWPSWSIEVKDKDTGVRPALHLDLSASNLYSYAGTVCSDGTVNETGTSENPTKPDTPEKPTEEEKPTKPEVPTEQKPEIVTVTGDKKEESKKEIKMQGGIDLTIPDSVPVLGGGKIKFDYGNFPASFWREDNQWRIGIGVKDINKMREEKNWTSFKQFVDTQKESYRKGINSLLAARFGPASMGMEQKAKICVYGYAEGTITSSGEVSASGGKLFLEIKGTAEKEWQTVVVVVPVVIKVKGEVGAKADFSVGLDFNNSKVYTKGKVDFTVPSVRLTGGIGVSHIADVSVYGEAKNLVTIEADEKKNAITGTVSGALGVSAKVLCFSYEKEILNGSIEYPSPKKKSNSQMRSGTLKIEPEGKDYEIQRVQSSSWKGSLRTMQKAKSHSVLKSASSVSASEKVHTLQSDVYASAKPQILQTESGKKVLIYTTDVKGRTTGNHTAAVYSIYNEQNETWSTPAIIENDGTADFDTVAVVDGEDIYVAWVNAKRTFTQAEVEDEDFMTRLASATEIHAAKIRVSGNGGEVTKYPSVTKNDIADLHPSVTVKNHIPYIAWNSNSANDILKEAGTNTIYLSSLNGNVITTKKIVEEEEPVQSVVTGILENDVVVAYTLNSGTEKKPQVQLVIADADKRRLITEEGLNLSPSFANINGDAVLLWYAQNNGNVSLNYTNSVHGNIESYIKDDAIISADYTVIEGKDSQLLIFSSNRTDDEKAGKNLYAYVMKDGKVSGPVSLTDLEGYVAVPSGIWDGTSYEYTFTRTDADITEENVEERTDLCMSSIIPKSNLEIRDIDYAQEELMPGKNVSVTIPVKNNGLTDCKGGSVQIVCNNTIIGQADIEDGIKSGETKDVTVNLTVPNNAEVKETLLVKVISGKSTIADSEKNIKSAGSELALSIVQKENNITAKVENDSAFNTTAVLNLKAGDNAGKVLKTMNLGNINSNDKVEQTFTKEELKQLGSDTIYMEVSGDAEESVLSDNTAFVYVGTEELKTLDYLIATKKKAIYNKGEQLKLEDLEVTAVYTDGSKAKITNYTTNIKNIDMSESGNKGLEIFYEEVGIGRKVIIPITVEDTKIDNTKSNTNVKPVTSIHLSGLSKKIAAGKKFTLKANILPKNASNQKLIWKSSNPKVATVTQNGIVTLKKKTGGKKITITATATDGSGVSASWKITSMRGIVKKVKITGAKQVKAGKKLKLKAKVSATKKANTKLLWTSNNPKIVTVNAKGVVKAKKSAKGKTVKITAMATDGSNKKATVKVKIK